MYLNDLMRKIKLYDSATLTFAANNKKKFTFAELHSDVELLTHLLNDANFKRGQLIGLYAKNCYDWIVWDIATLCLGIKIFAIPSEIEMDSTDLHLYIEQYGLAALVTDRELYSDLFLPVCLRDLVQLNADNSSRIKSPRESAKQTDNDELTYIFSSGTSGELKGLVIDRCGTEVSISRFVEDFNLTNSDSHVMFLPFSHFQQRMVIYACLHQGISLTICGYAQVLQVIETVRPSFIIAPPALYENLANLCKIGGENYLLKLRALSTHLRFAITGMAPIAPETINFFHSNKICLLEGYGVTEAGFISWNTAQNMRVGSVGRPVANITILKDGEIIVSEENRLTKCYFTTNGETERKVFLSNGEVATGDVGFLDEEGFLFLRGRLKDIVVTAGGKKFHPQELENLLSTLPDIKEAAIIDIDGVICCFLHCGSALYEEAKQLIRKQVSESMKSVESYKHINRVVFVKERFTPENGYRTRTFKINRKLIGQHYITGDLELC